MATKIQWTDETYNPVVGCNKISDGCKYCYAEMMAKRLASMGHKKYQDVVGNDGWNGEVYLDEKTLEEPLHWRKPRKVFVCSMGDLFHPKVPFGFIYRVFNVIRACKHHTFQLLTKRPENFLKFMEQRKKLQPDTSWPMLSNYWSLATCENQKTANQRIPRLLQVPAKIRGVSCEPLLEEINFRWTPYCYQATEETYRQYIDRKGEIDQYEFLKQLNWLIIGCERLPGNKAGRFNGELIRTPFQHAKFYQAVRNLIQQGKDAGVPVFFKQLPINGEVVSDINKFPKEFRIREWPNA